MPTYYSLQSPILNKGGIPLVIDISNKSGNYLYANQPTGDDSQWWTIIHDRTSGYCFIQSKWKNSKGENVVIDIHGASNTPGALLDVYPQKSKDYDNQLWKAVADVTTPGYSFFQSKLTDSEGVPLVIDIQRASSNLGTPIDAWPQKSKDYQNQIWTAAG